MKQLLSIVLVSLTCLSAQVMAQTSTPQSNHMKQYSLLVRVPDTYTREQAQSVGPQWDQLLEQWKTQGVYVLSFAFPGESYTVTGKDKTIKKESVLSDHLRVVSNLVLLAENMEQALELAKACPVLPYGGSVEVREIPKPLPLTK